MLFAILMPKTKQTKEERDNLYEEIAKHCDWLHIARYLKNEAKSALKYFHVHKLLNIKKNLDVFLEYLVFLNQQNCQRIEVLEEWKELKRELNNSVSYFYDWDNVSKVKLLSIQNKIETNTYEIITLMQGIKWCLILTIDEFCNASPTRVDILQYNIWKKSKKKAK